MGYFNREMLLDALLTQDRVKLQELMAQVDRQRIEQDILNDDGISEFKPFTCNDEVVKDEHLARMSESDKELLDQIFGWVNGSHVETRRGLKYLQKLKKKYPKVPVIYNLTGVAYHTLGKEMKLSHVIKETCKKFPHYLFGKISLAECQLNAGHHESIPEIFHHKLQLYMHHPDKGENPVFHVSEVKSFYTVLGRYYARNKLLAYAIKCYFIVESAEPESPHINLLARDIITAEAATLMVSGFAALNQDA